MQRYKIKAGYVNAVQYPCEYPGLKTCSCAEDSTESMSAACGFCGHKYIETPSGSYRVQDGDFIVSSELDGNVWVMSEKDFNDNYELEKQLNHIERMELEEFDLSLKLDGLLKFLGNIQDGKGPLLCDKQVELLEQQGRSMSTYLFILRSRIKFDKELMASLGVNNQ